MQDSVRTVISLNTETVDYVNEIVKRIKNKTLIKINFSMIIRASIIHLASFDSDELKSLLEHHRELVKWQLEPLLIKEKNVTLNNKTVMLIGLMLDNDLDYKVYKSGLIRLAIVKLKDLTDEELIEIINSSK